MSHLLSWFVPPTPRTLRRLRRYLELRRSEEFDADGYLQWNPDVRASGVDPLLHYIEHGEREGRRVHGRPPGAFAATRAGDAAPEPAFERRREHDGSNELSPAVVIETIRGSGLFDVDFYLAANPDVAAAGVDPLGHYASTGHREGRDPSPLFSTTYYRAKYLGGRRNENPLFHYIEVGRAAGHDARPGDHDLGDSLAAQIRYRTNRGDGFEEFDPSIAAGSTPRAKAIVFYLPQFHRIPENDAWWGTGFTEWTSVARGVPRFAGHFQPRVPRDLGFYDLSSPEVLPRQIELARAAGLHGFAFYYYWFNGKRLLERPVEQFLGDASLELPFCLMWANENWTRRWDGHEDEVLLRQEYRRGDDEALVADFARHFADPRYIRLGGRPLLLVYRLDTVPDARRTVARWRRLWRTRHCEEPLLFLAQGFGSHDPREFGLDGAVEFPPHKIVDRLPPINERLTILDPSFSGHVVSYEDVVERSLAEPEPQFPLLRTAVPGWDNDARRQGGGLTLHGATPALYERWLRGLSEFAQRHPVHGESLVFVNAWNEWAEAAYLEPDVHYGSAFLNATARALRAPVDARRSGKHKVLFVGHDAHPHGAQINVWHMGDTLRNQFGCEVAYLLAGGGELVPQYERLGPVCVADGDAERARAFLLELREAGYERAVTNTAVSGTLVPALKEAGFRVVSLIHELVGVIRDYGLEEALRTIMRDSDKVVCPAPVVAEAIRPYASGADAQNVVILPQGLYRTIEHRRGARRSIRTRLNLPAGAKLVLNVGFGDRRKGVDLFLGAAERAAASAPDLHFVWVGHLHVDVERALDGTGARKGTNVHFVPFTDDVSSWYRAADVFFLSSREDPFPSVVLEALSVGLPVVAFRGSGGIEDLVEQHGALVAPEDEAGAVSALAAAARESGRGARRARRETIRRRFRFDDYCFELLRLLDPELRKVSVVVPNFEYGRYLAERLESIFAQTHPVFEVLVLDDCSGDGSLQELDRIRARSGRRFRVVANDENSGGAIRQWAKGCRLASGDFVWIAEADDLSRSTFLERVAARLGPEMAFAFSDSAQVDELGRPLGDSYRPYYALAAGDVMERDFVLPGAEFVRRCLLERNLVLNVSAVVWSRRALAVALDERLAQVSAYRLAGDWLLYAAAALADGSHVAYVADPLNVHRRHEGSVTGALEQRRHLDEVRRVHATLSEWTRAGAEARAAMEAYEAELAAQFGLDGEQALRAG